MEAVIVTAARSPHSTAAQPTPTHQPTGDNEEAWIFLSPPDVSELERSALLRAFDSGWIAPTGPEIASFESELAAYVGAEDCAALSSGTAALHLGLMAVGVKPGDRVVVQTATFAASAFAVAHLGATPVFCDVDEETWNLDPALLEGWLGRLTPAERPAAVMPVDLYGLCPDYAELQRVCERFGLPIVEDAAEGLGSIHGGQHASTFGDVGALSFNGNKIITTSGGGALVGSSESMERIRYLATQARQPALHYEHTEIGFNYRISNLLAAMGRAQLSRIETGIARRTEIQARYRAALPDVEWPRVPDGDRPNNWLTVAMLPRALEPEDVCLALSRSAIEARPFWKPMHAQPVFEGAETIGGRVANRLYRRGICLPSGSSLTESDQDRVVAALEVELAVA